MANSAGADASTEDEFDFGRTRYIDDCSPMGVIGVHGEEVGGGIREEGVEVVDLC